MADTFRLTVLKALTSALEEITVANGYQHDLAGRVHRGRVTFTEEDAIPLLSIIEPPVTPEQLDPPTGSASVETVLPLLIQGFAKDDRDNPTDPAYLLLGDVQKRLGKEMIRARGHGILGFPNGRVTRLHLSRGVVRPPDELVSDTAFFWLQVTLGFGERLDDPFA